MTFDEAMQDSNIQYDPLELEQLKRELGRFNHEYKLIFQNYLRLNPEGRLHPYANYEITKMKVQP